MPGEFPVYPEVSISTTDTRAGAANPTTSHSFPAARRRLVSQPSPMTRESPGEIALRGAE